MKPLQASLRAASAADVSPPRTPPPQNRPVAAAAAGAASILVRQTNAVWLAASLGLYALLALPQRPRRGHSSALGGQGAHQHQGPASWYSPAPGAAPVGPLAALVQALPAAAPPEALAALALRLIPGVAVLFSVAAFFVWNGGVTVGDRDAHRPRAHWVRHPRADMQTPPPCTPLAHASPPLLSPCMARHHSATHQPLPICHRRLSCATALRQCLRRSSRRRPTRAPSSAWAAPSPPSAGWRRRSRSSPSRSSRCTRGPSRTRTCSPTTATSPSIFGRRAAQCLGCAALRTHCLMSRFASSSSFMRLCARDMMQT